ncbi:glycosyltransferase [Jiulongibacter sediminis]|uniref:glycosyltransferase n=1 Tax=Jiulongibacter sediminis TaxID=1605367 RepID=UPI0026E9ADC0|nr:glycosyltransferase [Jiulongibacter sediminis]
MTSSRRNFKIAAIIVTYEPCEHNLKYLLNVVSPQVDNIIVVDNSINQNKDFLKDLVEGYNGGVFLANDCNYGIAKALNQGFQIASLRDIDWVLTFDQDSEPYAGIVDILFDVYDNFLGKEKIGIIGVNYKHKASNSLFQIQGFGIYKHKETLITSGSMVKMKAFNAVRGFREDMFIDHVDEEFCLRLKKNGWVSLISEKVGMIHEAGTMKSKKILGIKFYSNNHTEFRRFYMSRNQILMMREYFLLFPFFITKSTICFIHEIISMMLIDTRRISKLRFVLKGVLKGLFYSHRNKKYFDK